MGYWIFTSIMKSLLSQNHCVHLQLSLVPPVYMVIRSWHMDKILDTLCLIGHQQRYFKLCFWLDLGCFLAQRKDRIVIIFNAKRKDEKPLPSQQSSWLKTYKEFWESKISPYFLPTTSNSYFMLLASPSPRMSSLIAQC